VSELLKRKLAFLLEASDQFFFLFFKRSLKGTLLKAMNPTKNKSTFYLSLQSSLSSLQNIVIKTHLSQGFTAIGRL
jgi:hypothetical protein